MPSMVSVSPPAGLRPADGVTDAKVNSTTVATIESATGRRPLASLTSGSQLPAIKGVASVQVIVVLSEVIEPQSVWPMVTDSISVGSVVPVIETS